MAAAAAAALPGGRDEPRVRMRPWREAACQWEAPAGGTREVACQSHAAQRRDVGVQADLPPRRLCWKRAGLSTRLPPRPASQNGQPQSQKAGEAREAALTVAAPPAPSGGRPQRTRRPPRWRQDLYASESPDGTETEPRRRRAASEDGEKVPGEEESVATSLEGGAAAARLVCDVCGLAMKNKSSLARHSFIHTGQKPFACPLCELRFNRRDNLRHHLSRLHPGGAARRQKPRPAQTWLCHVCGKTFRCRSALKTHEVIHLGVKPHRCDLCPKAYMRVNDLQHHKLTAHGGEERRRPGSLLCHFCGKEFKFRSQLAAHLQTHTDERPHLCEVCGRKFCRRNQLERHKLLVHDDDGGEDGRGPRAGAAARSRAHAPYRCSLCPRRFARPGCLRRHGARAHPGQAGQPPPRPAETFPCATCGKEFKFRSLLSYHAAVHSEERPHACDLCPRRFRRLGHLKRHRRVVHRDGARPPQSFVCHICGKDKKCRSQLARHVIIHTGERPFACDLCAARFNRRGNLQQHRKRVHAVQRPPTQDAS